MSMWQRLIRRYWLLLPLLLAIVVFLERSENPEEYANEPVVDMRDGEADYTLEDFTTRHFDSAGTLRYSVWGEKLSHFPDDNRSEIERPRIELLREQARWEISALEGQFDPDPERFQLRRNVEIRRTDPADDAEPVVIRTTRIFVSTDANEVHTDEAVTVEGPGFAIDAVGLSSAIDAGQLNLHDAVRARYTPPEP